MGQQLIEYSQHRSRIAAASPKTRAHRDVFFQLDVHPGFRAGFTQIAVRRKPGQVPGIIRQVRVRAFQSYVMWGQAYFYPVINPDGEHQSGKFMVAVGPFPDYLQPKVDLGWCKQTQ
jgi:hypothetical protein